MVIELLRIGLAIDENSFCMSITNKAEVLGFGSRFLISYFLYEEHLNGDAIDFGFRGNN